MNHDKDFEKIAEERWYKKTELDYQNIQMRSNDLLYACNVLQESMRNKLDELLLISTPSDELVRDILRDLSCLEEIQNIHYWVRDKKESWISHQKDIQQIFSSEK